MRDKTVYNWIDYLAPNYIGNINNSFEKSKVKLLLWLTILFGTVLLLMSPIFYRSAVFYPLYGCYTIAAIAVPFLLSKTKNFKLSAKVFLSVLLLTNTCIHLLIHPTNILSTGVWFFITILSASFIIGRFWSIIFTVFSLLVITISSWMAINHIDLGSYLGGDIKLEEGYITPILLLVPFALIHFILAAFFKNKLQTEGNVHHLLAEKEHLNQEIEYTETKYRRIIEGVDDLIWEIDENGMFTYMNPSMKKITGYDISNSPIFYSSPIPQDFLEDYISVFKSQILKANPVTYQELPIQTKSGEFVWIGQKTNMFFDENGNLLNALCIARDISAQKETEIRLVEAKEKAIKASLVKAQFLSSMSHEIRTPMNAVNGLIHLLLEENPREDQKQHLNTLLFSANNLLNLINDILDFSKIEAGKVEIKKAPFSFDEIINSMRHGFGSQAREKGIELIIKRDHRVPNRLIGDALRLSQVLGNLVNNAIKFTDEGSVTVYVVPKLIEDEMISIYFAIKDTGIGIPPEKLQSIFEDFVQVNDKALREGTGLGLSITKELLDLQGSVIKVDSTYGKGSTFYFTIDFEIEVEENYANIGTPVEQDLSGSLHGMSILLVEDNKINQKVATNFLSKWGVETDIADNGQIAVNMIQQKTYDVVLMDLQMPVMNGIEATKAIRKLGDEYAHVPILALTASAVLEIKDQVTLAGLNDFITKPFKPVTLYDKISRYNGIAV